jgi:hypothetical protein
LPCCTFQLILQLNSSTPAPNNSPPCRLTQHAGHSKQSYPGTPSLQQPQFSSIARADPTTLAAQLAASVPVHANTPSPRRSRSQVPSDCAASPPAVTQNGDLHEELQAPPQQGTIPQSQQGAAQAKTTIPPPTVPAATPEVSDEDDCIVVSCAPPRAPPSALDQPLREAIAQVATCSITPGVRKTTSSAAVLRRPLREAMALCQPLREAIAQVSEGVEHAHAQKGAGARVAHDSVTTAAAAAHAVHEPAGHTACPAKPDEGTRAGVMGSNVTLSDILAPCAPALQRKADSMHHMTHAGVVVPDSAIVSEKGHSATESATPSQTILRKRALSQLGDLPAAKVQTTLAHTQTRHSVAISIVLQLMSCRTLTYDLIDLAAGGFHLCLAAALAARVRVLIRVCAQHASVYLQVVACECTHFETPS